ncbi:hypothetical protein IQ07DRAFT_665220 [Pyrenochaeta sp. DS3sAY3a]|nr:hypothetical protein IQ07DRAFT_665220 [Pyrenochaeta sp. DS3sAY3a]
MFNVPFSFTAPAFSSQATRGDTTNDGDTPTVTPMRAFTSSRTYQASSAGNTTFPPTNGHSFPNAGPTPSASSIPEQPRRSQRKRRHAAFAIFNDQDSAPKPAPKKSKTNLRTPLGTRNNSSNSTPAASPRPSDAPFRASPGDPTWEDLENYTDQSAAPEAVPEAAPAPAPAARPILVARLRVAPWAVVEPQSMEAYSLLGLAHWRVGSKAITAAYRQEALKCHPDKVAAEAKGAATEKMQRLNAAKEMFMDDRKRHQYHLTGTLPWSG